VTLQSALGKGTTFTVSLPAPPRTAQLVAGATLRGHGAP
jgi:chemotaxis protein histidine kinase CheA